MRTRQQLEEIEKKCLAPFACLSASSHGRQYAEEEHPLRTAFQRDRDRIVHSSAFRRLEYKTQVFVNHTGDYYRTRLTHTLEVAQIARTIAQSLGLNETLAEAVSLAHDLGHTPFGHAGQETMGRLMHDHEGFEHNRQSFRIVTQLEKPYADFPGLNLTYEVLEGISKHADEYHMPDGTSFVKEGFPTLEAQLVNVADEIAYNNHDVDDGLKSGLLSVDDLEEVEIWQMHFKDVKKLNSNLSEKQRRRLTVKLMINFLVTDLIQNTDVRIRELNIKSIDDVRARGKDVVEFSQPIKTLTAELKRFLFKKLYRHESVQHMSNKAQTVIAKLFHAYTQNPNSLPQEFKANYDKNEKIERIVCDYIAGMTDRFSLKDFEQLTDSGKNSKSLL